MRTLWTGAGTALVTPFTKSGDLDEAAVRRLGRRQIDGGIHFLVPCGTTGENPTLTLAERIRIVEILADEADGQVPVLAGAGGYNTREVIHLADEMRKAGASGLLSVAPYYNKPTQEGLYQHFRAIAESTPLPIVLYNVPGRTGSNIEPATLARLAAIDNVVGVKEASGNLEQIMAILRDRERDFLVLSGDDAWTLPIMALGADGVISVASNEIPRLMREMVDGRDVAIHNRILPLMLGNFIESNPGPAKAALKMMGVLASDTVRPPLAPMTDAGRAKLEQILRDAQLLQ